MRSSADILGERQMNMKEPLFLDELGGIPFPLLKEKRFVRGVKSVSVD